MARINIIIIFFILSVVSFCYCGINEFIEKFDEEFDNCLIKTVGKIEYDYKERLAILLSPNHWSYYPYNAFIAYNETKCILFIVDDINDIEGKARYEVINKIYYENNFYKVNKHLTELRGLSFRNSQHLNLYMYLQYVDNLRTDYKAEIDIDEFNKAKDEGLNALCRL